MDRSVIIACGYAFDMAMAGGNGGGYCTSVGQRALTDWLVGG